MAKLPHADLYFNGVVGGEKELIIGTTPVQLQNFHGTGSKKGVEADIENGRFIIRVPRDYFVIFNTTYTFANSAAFTASIYKNGRPTHYRASGWGLITLRSNLTIAAPFDDLVAGDSISIHFTTDVDGRTITIYDTQFSIFSV